MKILFIFAAVLTLGGCMTSHDWDMEHKKALCVNFNMDYEVFKLPSIGEEDVICQNRLTGEYMYIELLKEKKGRPNLY